ncbi:MAG TPA: alpha-L-fucosidase [Acidimicrobiales bacterium]|jgi:alpha-L-fucosidase|nr:alpha-L-fucosidase [Acidimicrobiales bacterium]
MERGAWFDSARFGMFIHWGHVSQQGLELSWPMAGGTAVLPYSTPVPVEQYQSSAATFAPSVDAPKEWAALAADAGMRYAVFTSRHHDGFSMWPSAVSDFHASDDLVGAYVDAFRSAGLRVGLYYSLSDWHHVDYPALTDDDRPYAFSPRRSSPEAWGRFVDDYLFPQVRELLTDYGTIDVLWFDGGWERSAREWKADELMAMIRDLQPECLVNDRLPGHGDYETPEQLVPAAPSDGRWETCMTMNSTWGYCPADTGYKSARELVHTLCEVAGRGGNLLLNVGPRGDGSLAPEQVERLETVARWMRANAGSIHDTTPGLEPWQVYAPSTRSGDAVYVHLLARPYETATVRGLPIRRVRGVTHVASGRLLEHRTRCSVMDDLLNWDPSGELIVDVPADCIDDLATVLAIEIAPEGSEVEPPLAFRTQ